MQHQRFRKLCQVNIGRYPQKQHLYIARDPQHQTNHIPQIYALLVKNKTQHLTFKIVLVAFIEAKFMKGVLPRLAKQNQHYPSSFIICVVMTHTLLCKQSIMNSEKIYCIAQNSEKYMLFTLEQTASPSTIPSNTFNLHQKYQHPTLLCTYPIASQYFDDVGLIRKGVYPYEYMDSWSVFNETELSPQAHFTQS